MTVEVSRPEKVLFPDSGITKGELADYYCRVSKYMLPHIKGRPISMQRFPDGINRRGFFHKDLPEHFPQWISRVRAAKRGGSVTHAVADDAATLVYLADQACITPHVWLSRAPDLEHPDRAVFDLDPSGGPFADVRRAARRLGELLETLGLVPFAMTTGSRGLHVWVPLRPRADFDDVRAFARGVAQALVRRYPQALTLEERKPKRGSRILVDVMRNGWAQTAVPPYAVRPRPAAPVATPLRWHELSDARLQPDRYNLRNVSARLARAGDPWSGMARRARELEGPRRRLERVLSDDA